MRKRESDFVAEYLKDFDAPKAAIRAGFSAKGAYSNAYVYLRRPEIAAAVEQGLAARKKRLAATTDRVVEEYARIAFADIRRLFDWDEGGKNLRIKSGLSADDAAMIKDVEASADGSVRLRLYDKKASLDSLARHLGLFHPKAAMGPKDYTVGGRDAREVLRERLKRLARNGAAKKANGAG